MCLTVDIRLRLHVIILGRMTLWCQAVPDNACWLGKLYSSDKVKVFFGLATKVSFRFSMIMPLPLHRDQITWLSLQIGNTGLIKITNDHATSTREDHPPNQHSKFVNYACYCSWIICSWEGHKLNRIVTHMLGITTTSPLPGHTASTSFLIKTEEQMVSVQGNNYTFVNYKLRGLASLVRGGPSHFPPNCSDDFLSAAGLKSITSRFKILVQDTPEKL